MAKYTVENPLVIHLHKRNVDYYIWEESDCFYGTNNIEQQRGHITNARGKSKFPFGTIDEVKEYVLRVY